MSAFLYHINTTNRLPKWLASSNPLLGWEINNSIEGYGSFTARLPQCLSMGMTSYTKEWLYYLVGYVMAKLGIYSNEVLTIRRCVSTIHIPKDSTSTKLKVSLLVRLGMNVHHFNIIFEASDNILVINDCGQLIKDTRLTQRNATWSFWHPNNYWYSNPTPAFTKAIALLEPHLFVKPNGDYIYQKEINLS